MSDEPQKRRWWGWIGWALLAFLLLYPLSVGPMVWLETHDWIPSIVMEVYRPFWYVPADRPPWTLLRRWEAFWRDM
jgi:hypothetical protein